MYCLSTALSIIMLHTYCTDILIVNYHLEFSQVTFPPQILLQLTEGGEEEISVHDHVYKHIDESWYDTVYSCNS